MKVVNRNGTEIDMDVAMQLMDDETRERIAFDGKCETEQEFFAAYEVAHESKFGEEWELSKENPIF